MKLTGQLQTAALLLVAGLLGCALPPLAPDARPSAAPARPASAAPAPVAAGPGATARSETSAADQEIRAKILRSFDILDPAGLSGVRVEVINGVVTLTGVAPDLRTAWRAASAASAVAGVKKVHNELLVNQP